MCINSQHRMLFQAFIVNELKEGVTLYKAIGGYSNDEKIELITILDRTSYAKLLHFVHSVDEHAFMTVSTTNEFYSLDTRTISILKSEITRITNVFVIFYFCIYI